MQKTERLEKSEIFLIEIINKIKHGIVAHLTSLSYEYHLFNRTKIYNNVLLENSHSKYSNIEEN